MSAPTLPRTARLQTLWRRTTRLIDQVADARANGLWALAGILEQRLDNQTAKLADELAFQQGDTNDPEDVPTVSSDTVGRTVQVNGMTPAEMKWLSEGGV